MIRFAFLFSFSMTFFLSVSAQESTPSPEWLPDEPLQTVSQFIDIPDMVWLDHDTFIFEHTSANQNAETVTYQYQVSTEILRQLDTMPLRIPLTPEIISYYQAEENEAIYRSPFVDEGSSPFFNPIPIIYESRLFVRCGYECNGTLWMFGTYVNTTEPTAMGTYQPFTSGKSMCDLRVTWSRVDVAFVHMRACYGPGQDHYRVSLAEGNPAWNLPLYIGFTQPDFPHYLLAVSEDGTRVLYDSAPSDHDLSRESLYFWEAPLPTEANPLPDVTQEVEFPANNDEPHPFAAASFVAGDPEHILAVHTDGIIRIHLETGTREVLNPEINAQWIQLGMFSPDNTHLALITWDFELYVLETGV
jgi:hypothetical protein